MTFFFLNYFFKCMCEYIWVPVEDRRQCQSPRNLEYSVSVGNSTPNPLEGQ